MNKVNFNIVKKDFDYKHFDIDKLLNGSESREVNKYFGIYKLNILIGRRVWFRENNIHD